MILCNAFTAILLFAQNVLHCIINCYTPYHPLSTYAKFFEDLVFLTRNISRAGGGGGGGLGTGGILDFGFFGREVIIYKNRWPVIAL